LGSHLRIVPASKNRHQNQQPENSTGLNLKINSEFFLEKVPLSRELNVIQLQL